MLRGLWRWFAEAWQKPDMLMSEAIQRDREEERQLEALRHRLNHIGDELVAFDRRKHPRTDCR